MRKMLVSAALSAFLATGGMQPAMAGVLSYDEPPDIPSSRFPAILLGALDVGINTVTGNITCSGTNCLSGDFSDVFSVTLSAGLTLTTLDLQVDSFSGNNGLLFSRIELGSLVPVNGRSFAGPGGATLFSGAAGGPGSITMLVAGTNQTSGQASVSASYHISFTVTPVPEPWTLGLLGAGLLGLAGVRRRAASG